MILYLTSSPCVIGADRALLNPENGFLEHLKLDVRSGCNGLFVSSTPDDAASNRLRSWEMYNAFAEAGILLREMRILERTTADQAGALVAWSDVIILGGGHVPTQNDFFTELGLAALLRDYPGVILGISAGSMNCAREVYAQPELPGETLDPDYRLFMPGLGLTELQILPHYQQVKDDILDGRRLYEDITCAHSIGHSFLVLPDGSYVCVRSGVSMLHGEAYWLSNGRMRKICGQEQSQKL